MKDVSVLSSSWGAMKHEASRACSHYRLSNVVPGWRCRATIEQSLGSQQQTYTPSLAVVMGLIQTSHFKLWLAGNLRNWPLAEYQLSQMRATLHDCRVLFPNVTDADTSAILASAEDFRDAIRTKDGVKFDAAFQKFTAECNNCHKGAGLEFIKIRVPVTSKFRPPQAQM